MISRKKGKSGCYPYAYSTRGSLSDVASSKLNKREKGGRMGLDNFGGHVQHLSTSLCYRMVKWNILGSKGIIIIGPRERNKC